jgi:hypothetical protein
MRSIEPGKYGANQSLMRYHSVVHAMVVVGHGLVVSVM